MYRKWPGPDFFILQKKIRTTDRTSENPDHGPDQKNWDFRSGPGTHAHQVYLWIAQDSSLEWKSESQFFEDINKVRNFVKSDNFSIFLNAGRKEATQESIMGDDSLS